MNNKTFWISAANVMACLGVIILHCNSVFWSFPKGLTWYTSNFLETFFYWPVPVFFMISGATLIDYRDRYSTESFLKKRFFRTGIPFLFWSFISVVFRVLVSKWPLEGIIDIIAGIITTKYIDIYWFFIPLFTCYLSIPLLSAVKKELRIRSFFFVFICAFILNTFLPTVFALEGIPYNGNLPLPVAGGYIIYILAGYMISHTTLNRKHRAVIYCLGVLGWFLHFHGTTVLSFAAGELTGTMKGYLNFPAVLHSVGVFTAFRYFKWDNISRTYLGRLISLVSGYTFGIYLMHFYLVILIPIILHFEVGSIVWRTAGAAAIFVVCAIVSAIVSKIPVIKVLIGA